MEKVWNCSIGQKFAEDLLAAPTMWLVLGQCHRGVFCQNEANVARYDFEKTIKNNLKGKKGVFRV